MISIQNQWILISVFHREVSCSGANLFTCYCSLIKESIPPSMTLAGFTGGYSIRKSFPAKCHTSEENTINTIASTLTTIAEWMTSMCLKLNSDKTEFIIYGSRQMLKHANTSHIDFASSPIQQSKLLRYLDWNLDPNLTFEDHVKQKSKAAMLNFTKIKAIGSSLNVSACNTLVLMLCISDLDYSNASLYGINKKLPQIYQSIQNMCVKLVPNKPKYDSATECLSQLH